MLQLGLTACTKAEQASLLGTAPAYFKYLMERGQDTCLAKILGVYQVGPCRQI